VHFIVKATLPVDAGNRLIKGNMQATFDKVLADVRPEHVYFSVADGQRTIFMIVDLPNPTDMVRVGEPLWLALEADVEVFPAMTSEEFAAVGPSLGQMISKY
jgi:Domain of unknown function (DUF3303)